MKNNAVINVEKLVKKYHNRVVVNNVSFQVYEGEIFGLLGPNGAGKTTIFRILSGIINPDSGKVIIMNGDPKDINIRKRIGFCPQESTAYKNLTGLENILFYLRLYDYKGNIKEKAYELLRFVGLYEDKDKLVKHYSGGMKNRLNLAITLCGDPQILILDEPTTGMDPNIRRTVWDAIKHLKNTGKTIILATHYMEEAEELCTRVGIIDKGKIIDIGEPQELKRKAGLKSILEITILKEIGKAYETIKRLYPDNLVTVKNNNIHIEVDEADRDGPKIIRELLDEGFIVYKLDVRPPTLEDVFIKYTGRRLE